MRYDEKSVVETLAELIRRREKNSRLRVVHLKPGCKPTHFVTIAILYGISHLEIAMRLKLRTR